LDFDGNKRKTSSRNAQYRRSTIHYPVQKIIFCGVFRGHAGGVAYGGNRADIEIIRITYHKRPEVVTSDQLKVKQDICT
jgi:hypothetical protein